MTILGLRCGSDSASQRALTKKIATIAHLICYCKIVFQIVRMYCLWRASVKVLQSKIINWIYLFPLHSKIQTNQVQYCNPFYLLNISGYAYILSICCAIASWFLPWQWSEWLPKGHRQRRVSITSPFRRWIVCIWWFVKWRVTALVRNIYSVCHR